MIYNKKYVFKEVLSFFYKKLFIKDRALKTKSKVKLAKNV